MTHNWNRCSGTHVSIRGLWNMKKIAIIVSNFTSWKVCYLPTTGDVFESVKPCKLPVALFPFIFSPSVLLHTIFQGLYSLKYNTHNATNATNLSIYYFITTKRNVDIQEVNLTQKATFKQKIM